VLEKIDLLDPNAVSRGLELRNQRTLGNIYRIQADGTRILMRS